MKSDSPLYPKALKHRDLSPGEKAYFESDRGELPFKVTDYWWGLIDEGFDDPLRKQAIPRTDELVTGAHESDDPIGDQNHSPCEGLIHHYRDRALILVTHRCALYCRHCFRRHFTGTQKDLDAHQLDNIMNYIEEHSEIHEILLSGGDALMAPLPLLNLIFERLKAINRPLVIRLGTRLPVVDPQAVTDQMLDLLESVPSLWMVIQVNHKREISLDFVELVKRIQKRGIPMLNQSVLLKGVNDSITDLKDLCYGLIEQKIKPYYLFQGDLAKGTAHFRVPLERALKLYKQLAAEISHVALPRFALDLPGGGGKVNLEEGSLVKKEDDYYYFRNTEGEVGRYPREEEGEIDE